MFLFGQLYSLSSSLKLAHMFGSGPLQGVAPIRNLLAVHSVHHHVAGIFLLALGKPLSLVLLTSLFLHRVQLSSTNRGTLKILKAFAPAFSVFCPVPNWNFVPVSPTYSFTVFVYKCAGKTG